MYVECYMYNNDRCCKCHTGGRVVKFVAYLRVSTAKQGASGLGIEAQGRAVREFVARTGGSLLGEFVEVESGRNQNRPQLAAALSECRLKGATLLVAKLDRLSRNAHFLLGLKEAEVEFVCCDMPSANRLTVGIMAMVAEEEARMISARTRQALAAARARGTRLGTPNLTAATSALGTKASARVRKSSAKRRAQDLAPIIERLREKGVSSLRQIAAALNDQGIPAARGGAWQPVQVARVIKISTE